MGDPTSLQSEFDRVMTVAHQARWVSDVAWRDRDGLRVDDADLRARGAPRFARLAAMPLWTEVEPVLIGYVRAAIPAPRRSERTFWSCACLPDSDEALVLARLDVGAGDVCTVTADDALMFSFRLGLDPLDLPRFASRANLSVADLRTRPDGDVEVVLSAVGADAALALFSDDVLVRGMRRFNLDLARHGACASADEHSLPLADALLVESGLPPAPAPDDPAYQEPENPPPPPFPDVDLPVIDQLLATGKHVEARDRLVTRLAARGAEAVDLADPAEGVSMEGRAASALAEIVAGLPDDDPAVIAWVPRAALLGAEGAGVLNDLLVLAGRFHRRAGRPARGVEFVARALGQLEGRLASLTLHLLELGRCYTALGDLDAARVHLTVAWRHAESEPLPLLRVAVRAATAERHLRAPNYVGARAALIEARELARAHDAPAIEVRALAALAWSEERLDALGPAVAHYREVLARLGDDAPPAMRRGVLAGLVRCHDRRGERAWADKFLREAEAMTEPAWAAEGPWPCEELIDACLAGARRMRGGAAA